MPKLKTYTADLGGLPTGGSRAATPSDFGAQEAATLAELGAVGRQIGERLLKDEEAADARKMLVGVAKSNAKYAQAQQEAIATGADLDAMREQYANEMAAVRGTSTTRHGADTFDYQEATSMREFDVRAVQIRSARAGAQAKLHAEEAMSAFGTQVFNDPSALPSVIERVDTLVANLPTLVSPEQRAAIKQEAVFQLTGDAVRGLVVIDPEGTKKRLQAGEFALKPGQLAQEVARADAQIQANEARRQSAARNAAWERSEKSAEKSDVYIKQIVKGQFDAREAISDVELEPAMREHLFKFDDAWQRARTGEGRRSNPTVVNALLGRIYAPEDDPTRVRNVKPLLEAVAAGDLNTSDFRWLNAAVAEQRDPNNSTIGAQFNQMQRTLENAFLNDARFSSTPGGRIKAAEIINRWAFAVRGQMTDRRDANKSLYELFDPKSKDYIGNPQFIKQFEMGAGGVPTATTEAEVKALPPGAMYIDGAGNLRRTATLLERIPG